MPGVVITKNSKILLCAIHSKYIHSSPAVYYLKTAAELFAPENRFDVEIYEGSVNDSFDHLLYNITDRKSGIIGFSAYIWNIETVVKLCKAIKAVCPETVIILGGPEVSCGVEHTHLNSADYDYIISGEGEKAFAAAVCLAAGNPVPESIDYELNGRVIKSSPLNDLDEIPFVYNEENISLFNNRIVYYESSRGCPFSCAYCLSSICGKVRFLSLERVYRDLDFFIEHNVKQVKFVDRTFNCCAKRAAEIWNYILKRSADSRTNFHFEIGADLLDETALEILRKMPAGKVQLEIGIQSTNERALKESCRYAPTQKIINNVTELVKHNNINVHTDLIAGLPFEDLESFKKSFNDVYALHSHQLQLGFLKLLRGAPLNNITENHGYIFSENPPYEVLANKYISFDELLKLKEVEDALEKLYNSGRFLLTLKRAENLFNNPFEMFTVFAQKMKQKNLLFRGVSTRDLYDFLNEFAKENHADFSLELLEDFYLSENSQVVPASLRSLVPLNKYQQSAANSFLKENGFSKDKKVLARFIKNEALAIDYSDRNSVTGRYTVLLRKEVNFDE